MTDVIHAPTSDIFVRSLDVIPTHVGRLGTDSIVRQRRAVGLFAQGDLVLAAVGHVVGEFHVVVHGVVDLFVSVPT